MTQPGDEPFPDATGAIQFLLDLTRMEGIGPRGSLYAFDLALRYPEWFAAWAHDLIRVFGRLPIHYEAMLEDFVRDHPRG